MIRLIVDSTFGLPKEFAEQNGIEMVSLKVVFKDKSMDVKFEDSWNEIYENVDKEPTIPTTSQPSPAEFMDAIDKIYAEDPEAEILILTLSNSLSGTINSATIAASNYPGKKIVAIDAMQAATCSRIMAEELVEKIKEGKTFEEIQALIPVLSQNMQMDFIPNTMDALKKGGRIGTLAATLASILNIKPLFRFKDGKISIVKKLFGLGKAIAEIVQQVPEKLKKIYLVYIQDSINIPKLMEKCKDILKLNNVEVVPLEPIFGVHVGKGGIGIASLAQYE